MSEYINEPTDKFAWPTIDFDIPLLLRVHGNAITAGNQYGLGDKVPLDIDSTEIGDHDVDCSGYVRWLVYKGTGSGLVIPDGSYIQHDWVKAKGFKSSSVENAKRLDGVVRIAFLPPGKIGKIGHVALVYNGRTFESHSGTGPDSRSWTGTPRWQANCTVYALTAPDGRK